MATAHTLRQGLQSTADWYKAGAAESKDWMKRLMDLF